MAPELLRNEKYDSKVDIWATGVIGYMLLSGVNPFPTKTRTNEELKTSILNPKYPDYAWISKVH